MNDWMERCVSKLRTSVRASFRARANASSSSAPLEFDSRVDRRCDRIKEGGRKAVICTAEDIRKSRRIKDIIDAILLSRKDRHLDKEIDQSDRCV
mmetsp:Transcript_65432/g.77456  ORF Transcript_65432/g.77456 Transcript_65432/m.77456 type:complete len:95 (-) Transcript_65432:88-372(-)